MRGGLNLATIRRNAEACEAARSSRCECACGGKLHGMRHSLKWMETVLEASRKARSERAAAKSQAVLSKIARLPLDFRGIAKGIRQGKIGGFLGENKGEGRGKSKKRLRPGNV